MKIWLFTPSFCKADLLEDCLKHIYLEKFSKDIWSSLLHVIIDNHYPVDQENNSRRLKELAAKYGCIYVDSGKDLGLHEGVNNAMKVVGVKSEDFFIGCDPDDRPSHGWIQALVRTMTADPSIAVLGLNFWVIEWRKGQGALTEKQVGEDTVWVHPGVEMWNIAAFRTSWLLEIGGLKQPNAYYGGLEAHLHHHMAIRGLKLAYLPEYRSDAAALDRDNPLFFDADYRQWKTDHVAGFKGSFEEWLKQHRKGKPEMIQDLISKINECGILDPEMGGKYGLYRIQQNPIEFANYVYLLKQKFPHGIPVYLQIGLAGGGDLRFLSEHVGFKKCITIDLNVFDNDIRNINTRGFADKLVSYWGDSHSDECKNWLNVVLGDQKIDACFIDGDHSYRGILMDYELVLPYCRPGSLMSFHDIATGDETKPPSDEINTNAIHPSGEQNMKLAYKAVLDRLQVRKVADFCFNIGKSSVSHLNMGIGVTEVL